MSILFRYTYLIYINEGKKTSLNNDAYIMRKILGYIAEKYDQDITLEELAKVGFISVTKCLKLFKEYTSLSPIAYLIKYRLNIAYELIKESDDTIIEIASKVGFSSQSYFTRMFVKEYKVTPLTLRKNKQFIN